MEARSEGESRWPATFAVLFAIAMQLVLPDTLLRDLGPRWLLPAVEGVLVVVLVSVNPRRIGTEASRVRVLGLVLIALIGAANIVSVIELVHQLLIATPAHSPSGTSLIEASVPVWLTNIVVFGLWFWELDRGGPAARIAFPDRRPDFLFPQMATPQYAAGWLPRFHDYLYTAFTNATAFSPTDTMPLSAMAKMLMMAQSLTSLLIVVLVVSRAINILQ